MSLFKISTVTTALFAALTLTGCDANPPAAPETPPTPRSETVYPPMTPTMRPPVASTPPVDYTEVLAYLRSAERTAPLRQALNTAARNVMMKMERSEIPHALQPAGSGSSEGTLTEPPQSGYGELLSLPLEVLSLGSCSSRLDPDYDNLRCLENERRVAYSETHPRVSITVHVVDGKPDPNMDPLGISVTWPDGSKVTLGSETRTIDSTAVQPEEVPFTGETSNTSISSLMIVTPATNQGTPEKRRTELRMKVMGMNVTPTVDNARQVDKIIMRKLKEVEKLNGSDWPD